MMIFVLSRDEENKCDQARHLRLLAGLRVPGSPVRLHEDFPQEQNCQLKDGIRRRRAAKS